MNHPVPLRAATGALMLALVCQPAWSAPDVVAGPVFDVCASPCETIGGVGLAGNEVGVLVEEAGVISWVVLDRTSGAENSSTPLGNSAGFFMQDVSPDGAGGAWIVGYSDNAGTSTAGRWHSGDVSTRETLTGVSGTADVRLFAVSTDGTAFGVSNGNLATRILPDGTAVNMAAGLADELPTSIFNSLADGGAAVGDAQFQGVLTLSAWDGNTLSYQDNVPGGNGVIGNREDGSLVLLGIRIGGGGPELAAVVDPFGAATMSAVTNLSAGELAGMDRYGFGYAFGDIEGDAAIVDLNDMDILMLSDVGLGGYESLVAMDHLGGSDWLLVLRGSAHFTIASINAPGLDSDGDSVPDGADNCLDAPNPNQIDADGDLIGNRCDADYNNDCIVNALDLGILRLNFFSTNPVTDLTGDGITNAIDLGLFKSQFFQPPGPGADGNLCE